MGWPGCRRRTAPDSLFRLRPQACQNPTEWQDWDAGVLEFLGDEQDWDLRAGAVLPDEVYLL